MSFLRKAIYNLYILSFIAFPSCINDKLEPCQGDTADDIFGYLELTVSTEGSTTGTRANPTGGETGDGYEHGLEKENIIYNLTAFAYYDNNSLGFDGKSLIKWKKYINEDIVLNEEYPEYPTDRKYNVKIPLTKADFYTLNNPNSRIGVVANAGDLTDITADLTINDLSRKLDYGVAWRNDEKTGEGDYFVMSSAFNGSRRADGHSIDGQLVNLSENNGEVAFSCKVSLERVAARIDLLFSNNEMYNNENGSLTYRVKQVDHTVRLTNVIPVNAMQQNSYLFKQLSSSDAVTDDYLGWRVSYDETTDESGRPNNYVISPNFFNKDLGSLDQLYGSTRASSLRKLRIIGNDGVVTESPHPNSMDGFSKPIDIMSDWNVPTGDKAIIISYVNENTHPKEVQVAENASDYLTGLLIRAQYHPERVYTTANVGEGAVENVDYKQYNDGQDFWLFRTVGADNTNAVEEKYNLYFATKEALDDYVALLPSGGKYETVAYPKGICYYNVWVKHANKENSDDNFPMKYGIVRNNIYRISLGFNGIGQPTPEITEPQNVTSRIYVIKWNFRPQEIIEM